MEREMNFLEILQALKKRITVLILITLSFTLLGGGLSFLGNEKVYRSAASVIVGVETQRETGEYNEISGEPIYETFIQYGNTSISAQSIKFYNEILSSSDLLDEVINNLSLDITADTFREQISLEVPENSGSMVISVAGPQLNNADQIVNELVAIFQEKVLEVTEIDKIKPMNSASNPQIKNTVNIIRNTLISFVAGFVIGTVLVLIIEYLDDSVQSVKEIEDRLGITVIGKVRNEESLKEDLTNIRTYIEFSPKFNEKKSFVISKVTQEVENISTELASVLTEIDKRVLLLEADFREPYIQKELGLNEEKGLSDYLAKDMKISDVVKKHQGNDNYQVVTAGTNLEDPSKYLSNNKFEQLILEQRSNFDYILVDGYPVGDILDSVVLSTYTDGVILVANSNTTKMMEIKQVQKKFNDVGVNILGIVLNDL